MDVQTERVENFLISLFLVADFLAALSIHLFSPSNTTQKRDITWIIACDPWGRVTKKRQRSAEMVSMPWWPSALILSTLNTINVIANIYLVRLAVIN